MKRHVVYYLSFTNIQWFILTSEYVIPFLIVIKLIVISKLEKKRIFADNVDKNVIRKKIEKRSVKIRKYEPQNNKVNKAFHT